MFTLLDQVRADEKKNILRVSVAQAAMESGLVQALTLKFERKHRNIKIKYQLSGAIQALDNARKGLADLTLTHHSAEEKRLVSQGIGIHRTQIFYSEYALLGPPSAYLKISHHQDIIEVLRQMAKDEVAFLEPSPKGGTYRKIRELWSAAGINPNWIDYENTGTSALGAMRQAAVLNAYTMAEVGTYIKYRSELGGNLALLYRDDISLRNVFSVVVVNAKTVPNVNQSLAISFFEFLVSAEAQHFIEEYNQITFGTSLLSPAAHMDDDLLMRRAEKELLKKKENVQLLTALSIGLFFLFITTTFFGYRFYISNIRRLEMEKNIEINREARDVAINANKIKSDFLANMSHEIRTPLTAIIGYAEILRDDKINNEQRGKNLNTIISGAGHLLNLINDILDVSKIEAEKLETENISVELMPLLDDVRIFVQLQSREKALSFDIKYNFPLPRFLQTDPVRLKQILLNLCCNAIKFTEKGGITLHVACDEKKEIMSFDIIDTGIGINDADIEKIFVAFSQADASTTRKYGGTGLGLSLSKQLAEKLGGDITVKSQIGKGSQFLLTINTGSLNDVEYIHTEKPSLVLDCVDTDVANNKESSLLSGHVLLAEDVVENQDLVVFYLDKLGVQVSVVENGKLALNAAEKTDFDLVLMDLQMPVMGGIEAVTLLRKNGFKKPIVALSANVTEDDKQQCLDAGCNGFLEKPINRNVFIGIIKKYLV